MTTEYKNNQKARLIISLDFELGWGSIENGFWKKRQDEGVYKQLRSTMAKLMQFLDERELVLSWATVGAMVSEKHKLDLAHIPDSLQGKYSEFIKEADAFSSDGRDLYEMVLNAKTTQHVCSHTYSHVRFSYPDYSEDAITQDLLLSKSSKNDSPTPIDALVFPLNHDTSYVPLARAGYKLGRSKPIYRFGQKHGSVGKILDQIVLPPPMVEETTDEHGIVHHSGSMFFNWPGSHTAIRKAYVKNAAYRGLNNAVEKEQAFHLWLHPYNLAEIQNLQSELMIFLQEACKLRDAGKLDIVPMAPARALR